MIPRPSWFSSAIVASIVYLSVSQPVRGSGPAGHVHANTSSGEGVFAQSTDFNGTGAFASVASDYDGESYASLASIGGVNGYLTARALAEVKPGVIDNNGTSASMSEVSWSDVIHLNGSGQMPFDSVICKLRIHAAIDFEFRNVDGSGGIYNAGLGGFSAYIGTSRFDGDTPNGRYDVILFSEVSVAGGNLQYGIEATAAAYNARIDVNLANTVFLESIEFPDGTTPESQGFHIVFDSGIQSPNVRVAGDTDADGDVDLEDLNNVRNNFGVAGPTGTLIGDAQPYDGQVDLNDLNSVRNHFGVGTPPQVPEPDSLRVLVVGAIAIAALCCHRRH